MFRSLVSSTTTFSARRRTVHLFHAGNATELGIASPTVWIDNTPAVWDELDTALAKLDPKKIAVNVRLSAAQDLFLAEHLLCWLADRFRPRVC